MKKTTFIIFGIFLIILGYYYFFEIKKKPKSEINEIFFTIEQKNIDKFSIKYGNVFISCKKEKDQWVLTDPLKDNADSDMVKKIFEEIANLFYYEKIEKDQIKNASLFGFSNPQLEFNFWTKEKKETIFIGENSAIGQCVYLKKNQDENIYLVGKEILFILRQDKASLRNKKILSFKKDDVINLKIIYPKKNIEVVKKSVGKWDLIFPLQIKADKYVIDNIFTILENLEAIQFIPYSESNFKYYNLNKPEIKIILNLKENEIKEISFGVREKLELVPSYAPVEIRNKKIKVKEVYAKVKGKEEIFAVNESIIQELTKDSEIFQDKKVFDFKLEEIDKVCLIYPNQEFICTKKNEEWNLEKPIKALADKYVVEEIIRNMVSLKAEKIIENVKDLSKYKFDKQIILQGKNQKFVLFLGNKKNEKESVYGLNEAEKNKVFTIEKWMETCLTNKDLISLREKSIFNFKKDDVESFKIKYLSKSISGIKKNETNWQIKINRKKNIESATINLFLDSLSRLRANEFITDNLKPLSEYQLNLPQMIISLEIKEKKQKVILIGKFIEDKKSYYAQIEKTKEIFCLPFYQIEDIQEKIINLEKEN